MSGEISPRSFQQKMLSKLKQYKSSFPELDTTESKSSVFSQLWERKRESLTMPDYCKSKSNSFSLVKDSVVLHLILGKKLFKTISESLVNKNPQSEEMYFKLFRHYLYRGELEESLENISKCVIINPKKYQKWKALNLFYLKKLDLSSVKNTKDWEKEALLLEVYLTKCEQKAADLFKKDRFFGSLAWIYLYSVSSHPDKKQIILNIAKKLMNEFPNIAESFLLALVVMVERDPTQAAELCDSLLERSKNGSTDIKVFLKITQAKIIFLQNKSNQSLEILKDLYLEHPTYSRILYYFGKFCIRANRQNTLQYGIGALKAYRKFDNPNNAKALLLIIQGYASRNQVVKVCKNCLKLPASQLSQKSSNLFQDILKTHSHEIEYLTHNTQETRNKDFLLHFEAFELIKSNNSAEALKKLRNLQIRQEIDLVYTMEEIKILSGLPDQNCLSRCNELLRLIANSKTVSSQWIKALLFYARYVVDLESFEDAIRILICIGYIYPALPLDLPFVNQTFSQSKSLKDIIVIAAADYDELKGRRKAEQLAVTYSEMISAPVERRYSSNIPRPKFFKNLNRDSSILNFAEKLPEKLPKDPTSLFVCTFPVFLYKIGKISALYKVKEFEGILSLKDFLKVLQNFNFLEEIKKKYEPRGIYYLCLLLKATRQDDAFEEVHGEFKENPGFSEFASRKGGLDN